MVLINNKVVYILLFLLAYLYVLGFPPVGYLFFTIISMVAITRIVNSINRVRQLLIASFAFSLGISVFGFYWIFYSVKYVIPSNIVAGLSIIGFAFLYSFFIVIPFFLMSKLNKINNQSFITTVFAWGLFEISKFYLFGGFPWFNLATIWVYFTYIMQSVVLIGSLGLGILTVLLVAALNSLICKSKMHYKLMSLGSIIIIFFIITLFGYYRVKEFRVTNYGSSIPIRVVQTDVKQDDKMSFYKQNEIFYSTLELAFKNIDYSNPPKYIILPEVAFNFVLEDENDKFQELKNKIPASSILLLGVLRENNGKYYNSMYAINGKTKQVVGVYDKNTLVPFGEYIPYSSYIPFVNSFVGLSNLEAGNEEHIFQITISPYATANKININDDNYIDKFLVLICFEIIFQNYRAHIDNVDWVLNIGNEGWFNKSSEQAQHLSLAQLRAIEGIVPVVKVSNNGFSGLINIIGEIDKEKLYLQKNILDIYLPVELSKSNLLLTFRQIGYNLIIILFLTLGYLLYIVCILYKNYRNSY